MLTRRQLLAASSLTTLPLAAATPPLPLHSRRELFVDHYLIDSLTGAELRLAQPIDAGPVFQFDRPWEGRFCNYATVIKDAGTFRLYYRGVPNAGADGRGDEVYCYAESPDGTTFQRPNLQLHSVRGTDTNNVILAGTPPLQHNFSPFLDTRPGVPPASRYKGLAGTSKSGLVAFHSPDGLRWTPIRTEPVLTQGAFDSQNLAFWSEAEQQYVCYYRTFKKIGSTGYRWISRAVSPNFLDWKIEGEVSFGNAPPEHLYTNQTSPYFRAPHLYLSLCARFLPGRQVLSEAEARAINVDPAYFKDCSDAVLLSSRGGTQFDRTFLDAFLRPGLGIANWVSRSNYPALNVVPTGPEELSFYVVRNYGQPSIHLRRYTLRLDGFTSLHAGYSGGQMITKPFTFAGAQLEVNFATSAPGGIHLFLETPSGTPLVESTELIGDQTARFVQWKTIESLTRWSGQPVRLRATLKDADLFAIRFV
ncbi:MAG: hypothetical protein NTV52_09865 [Acidobacteria bacterium]|nr:hypothetical protein [Acidobacteriota bacterium]